MKSMDKNITHPRLNFFVMAFIALLANLVSTELHEFLHLIAGRLCGLPTHFFNLTSAGVDPSIAATARPSSLALMNGVAPLATMLLGVTALFLAPVLRRRAPAAITAFAAWCAIFAIPYIGLQLMTAALRIRLNGTGADSAAVIGGYFGVPFGLRVVITLLGLLIFLASGFWLSRAVSDNFGDARCRLTPRKRLQGLGQWRVAVAFALSLLMVGLTVRATWLLVHHRIEGFSLLLWVIWVYGATMALLVRWQADGAREVRDQWIFPGLVASLGILAVAFVTQLDDFLIGATIYVIPLIATAWTLIQPATANHSESIES